jgi:hypothetical protein
LPDLKFPITAAYRFSVTRISIFAYQDSLALLSAMADAKREDTCNASRRRLNYGDTYQLLLDVKSPVEIEEN